MKCSRFGRFAIVAAFTAGLLARPTGVFAAPTPTPTPVPVFKPVRVQTEKLGATGLGTAAAAPFTPLHVKTDALKAQGLGKAAEAPFKPIHVRTDALGAQGLGTGGTK
ncbi:MAG: hypothetical protein NEA02_00645 [Thermoanaerobaculia bacterium]|nr:hypothetical protein [Thermoanaerobaculia bacterium]